LPHSSTKSSASSPVEKCFSFNGFNYACQLWGEEDGLPVIALHGWLDNSGSFACLAPQLSGVQCLAVDLAGHGLSDHKAGLDDYPLWSDTAAIYAIADQMGWDTFALIGHSRGAMMSLLISGTYPQRISHLILIDAIMPPLVENEGVLERMTRSIEEVAHRLARKATQFPSRQDAITARCMSRYAPVTAATAEQLARRGLSESATGQFFWHADSKLWSLSAVGLSADMLQAFVKPLSDAAVPCLLLLGKDGLVTQSPPTFIEQCQQLAIQISAQIDYFDDGHFLHMEKAAEEVAQTIQLFLSASDD
jgi:pimeloyl-ACP methyl ester carboxylesterase